MKTRPERPVRQQFSVTVGWIGVVIGMALIIAGALGQQPRTTLSGVAVAAASYCVMCQPSLYLTGETVVVRNVIREVTLPWQGISHATSRGSLVIHDNDGGRTTVWAISSQKARRGANDGDTAIGTGWRPLPDELTELPTSSRAVAAGINAETVDNPADTPSGRRVRWLPVPCALMIVAVVSVLGFMVA